ncbi:MAG: hypothetical protein RR314_07670 [Oscillospiraceae bacterium]
MKKLHAKKELKKQIKKDAAKTVRKDICKKAGKQARKIAGKLAIVGALTFVGTFTLYMFNLENKLIYYVITPLLQKHYNAQTRDRKI